MRRIAQTIQWEAMDASLKEIISHMVMEAAYMPVQNIPFSPEAEEAVIGSVLINPGEANALIEFLKPIDFFLVRNRHIWEAVLGLLARGESIDYLIVVEELKAMGKLDEVGGELYIMGLFRNTPTSVHAEAYGRIVERAAIRRHLLMAGDMIRGLALNESMDLEEVIAECDKRLYEASSRHVAMRQWQFVSRDELVLMPPVEWLIDGVLPAKSLGMIFGPSGSFKSFYALNLSVDVAQTDNVLYVVAEGESGMPSRLLAHEIHFKRNTDRITFCLGAVDMFNDVELTAFKRHAARHRPALVIVDTFAMCTGDADENQTRDMKIIVEGCKRMIKELQCAVLVVHHTNKEGKQERGNQSLRNACDTVVRVSLQDDVIKVEHQKSKDKAIPAPQYFRRVIVGLGYKDKAGREETSVVLMPSEKVRVGDEMTEKQRQVLETLIVEPTASVGDLADIIETTRGTITSILKTLQKRGYLSPYNGKERTVTKTGRDLLGETDSIDSIDSTDSSDSHQQNQLIQQNQMNQQNQRNRQPALFPPTPRTQYERGN